MNKTSFLCQARIGDEIEATNITLVDLSYSSLWAFPNSRLAYSLMVEPDAKFKKGLLLVLRARRL